MVTIAHISDPHVGSPHFVPNLMNRVIAELNQLQPDVVVVSGDLTTDGFRPEYKAWLAYADRIEAPILALQAGADQNITAEDNAAFEQALQAAGVEHELVTYEDAPHSFFDRKQEEFADASEDAWAKVLAFLAKHS